ncbi:uncharacterized protein LOC143847589 isoform X2 [Tasmannia lanceolata]
MGEAKASFILHCDGYLKQEGSFDYVGGSIKFVMVDRRIKFLELESLIHNKIGTRSNEVSLSIKCRYVVDPLHVILYEIKDDDDLQSMMEIFDNKGYNSLCLYITKHQIAKTINYQTTPFSTSIPPSVIPQDRQCINDPLENEPLDILRNGIDLMKDFEDGYRHNQVHEQVDDICTDAEDNNMDANVDEPHDNVVGQSDSTHTPSLPSINLPIEDEMVITHSEDDKVGDGQCDLKVGATFRSLGHFKRVLREFAIRRKFIFYATTKNTKKYSARCKEKSCPWRICAIKSLSVVRVKKFLSDHTCSLKVNNNDHPFVSAAWVAETCSDLFSRPADIKVSSIVNHIKVQWGITMSYRKAFIAKQILLDSICGNDEDSYRILPAYSFELTRSNHGSYMCIVRSRDLSPNGDDSFARLFWTFGPCIRAFNRTLRPLVLMDGTHLKGKYPGILLIACGIDGNNGLFPLAFAIVETEMYESWSWFLNLFRTQFMSARSNAITICSDPQKGLLKAVPEVFPNSHHSFCMRHLSEYFHDIFKNMALYNLFWKAARTLRESEFKWAMESIKEHDENAYQWISEIPKENWASVYFKGNRYDALTTNRSECFNAILKEARGLPIVALVEHTRSKISNFFQLRRKVGQTWTKHLTSYGEKHVQLAAEIGRKYTIYPCGIYAFEVRSVEQKDVVDLEARTCSCGVFQTMGLPCAHAMAAISNRMLDPYDFCQSWFFAEKYRDTYEETIYPTLDRAQWEPSPHPLPLVLPPLARRTTGRPKTSTEKELTLKPHNKCKQCGEFGHNKRSCKNPQKRSQAVNMNSCQIRKRGRPKTGRTERVSRLGTHNKCSQCGQFGHNRKTCKNPLKRSQTVNMDLIEPSALENHRFII